MRQKVVKSRAEMVKLQKDTNEEWFYHPTLVTLSRRQKADPIAA